MPRVGKKPHVLSTNTNARSAILDKVREVADAKAKAAECHEIVSSLYALLPSVQQRSLVQDVIYDMTTKTEVGAIHRTVELIGDKMSADALRQQRDTILTRIFNPIFKDPTEASLNWIEAVGKAAPDLFDNANSDALEELSLKLQAAFADKNTPDSMRASIEHITSLAKIELQSDAPDAESTPSSEASETDDQPADSTESAHKPP